MTKILISCLRLFLVVAAFCFVSGCMSPQATPQPAPSATLQPVVTVTQTSPGLSYDEFLRVHPPPPQNVRAVLQTDHISLRWEAPVKVSVPHDYSDTVAYYRIYKSTTENDLSYFTSAAGPAFNDSNISKRRQYIYQITAVQTGESESSPSGNVIIEVPPGTENGSEEGLTFEEYRSITPPPPENLAGAFRGDHIELRWDAPVQASVPHSYSDTISYYRIYKGTGENSISYLTSTTDPAFNDFNISANRRYFYMITAVQGGETESSAGKTINVAAG
jgi:fibronectin type 3 domain-containing protein